MAMARTAKKLSAQDRCHNTLKWVCIALVGLMFSGAAFTVLFPTFFRWAFSKVRFEKKYRPLFEFVPYDPTVTLGSFMCVPVKDIPTAYLSSAEETPKPS